MAEDRKRLDFTLTLLAASPQCDSVGSPHRSHLPLGARVWLVSGLGWPGLPAAWAPGAPRVPPPGAFKRHPI